MRHTKEALLTFFEVVAYGALLLLLPCVVAGLIFDSILADILAQIMLVAVAGTAILTAIAIHEGWYPEHLSGWGLPAIASSLVSVPSHEEQTMRSPSDRAK